MLLRRRSVQALVLLAFWNIPPLLYASNQYVLSRLRGEPAWNWGWVSFQAGGFYGWIVFTPIVFWLARRVRIDRAGWWKALLVHVVTAAAIVVLNACLAVAFFRVTGTMENEIPSFAEGLLRYVGFSFHQFFLLYWFVLGVGYAIDYYQSNRRREVREAQLERELARAELRALQMQLHPHFLFNTLHAIGSLIRQSETKQALAMLVGLSDLLRHALGRRGRQEVQLFEEVDFATQYLRIEESRFRDRLRVRWKVPDDALACLVPNLLLQPLVENAIRHGIARRGDEGTIRIEVERDAERLRIAVRNDGPPLPEGFELAACEGVGLRNTIGRLQRLHGGDASLELRNVEGGVEARVDLPCIELPDDDD